MLVDTLYIVHVYGQCMTIQSFTFIDMLQYCFFSCTYKICHTIYSVEQHGTSYYNYPQTLCVAQPLTLRMSCCRIYDEKLQKIHENTAYTQCFPIQDSKFSEPRFQGLGFQGLGFQGLEFQGFEWFSVLGFRGNLKTLALRRCLSMLKDNVYTCLNAI